MDAVTKDLYQSLRTGVITTRHVADACLVVAILYETFAVDRGCTLRLIHTETKGKSSAVKRSLRLPEIHEHWKTLARAAQKTEYVSGLTDTFDGFRVYAIEEDNDKLCVCVIDASYANHVCSECTTVYSHEINKLRCQASDNHVSYSAKDIRACWDSLTHEQRTTCIRGAKGVLNMFQRYGPINDFGMPSTYKKILDIVDGNVDVTGRTLLECLQDVTERTCLLKTYLKEVPLRESVHNVGFVAIMAHEICEALLEQYIRQQQEKLIELVDQEAAKRTQQRRKKKKMSIKHLEHIVFNTHIPLCTDWAAEV